MKKGYYCTLLKHEKMSVNEVKNKPAPFELEVRGTGHPGSRTFAIGDEDHTLGNSIRHVLMQNSKVAFAGYSVPHPSEPVVHIRVQTAEKTVVGNNDRQAATDVLKEACETLISQCDAVLDQVEELCPEVREDRIQMEKILEADGYEEEEQELLEDEEGFGVDEEMMDAEEEEY